ncbi:MAG: DNA repair protein RadC [bacterium]
MFTLNDLPSDERPRERLQLLGSQALSTQELLALILGRGIKGESVMMTAQRLLSTFGSLDNILNASLEDLQQIHGLGVAKASQLLACSELLRRVKKASATVSKYKPQATDPEAVALMVKQKIRHYAKEHFFVLSFDTRNRLLGTDTISVGTLNSSLVHPRETFEAAIRRHAAAIILVHNHPSGDLKPSPNDILITDQLVDAGKILGIEVLDHVIVTQEDHFSLKQFGLLGKNE